MNECRKHLIPVWLVLGAHSTQTINSQTINIVCWRIPEARNMIPCHSMAISRGDFSGKARQQGWQITELLLHGGDLILRARCLEGFLSLNHQNHYSPSFINRWMDQNTTSWSFAPVRLNSNPDAHTCWHENHMLRARCRDEINKAIWNFELESTVPGVWSLDIENTIRPWGWTWTAHTPNYPGVITTTASTHKRRALRPCEITWSIL